MKRTFSMQAKIVIITAISLTFLFSILTIMHSRDIKLLDKEAEKSHRMSNSIALNGVLLQQDAALEKILTNLLNTDEVLEYSINPNNKVAESVVRGLMASLDSVGASRLTMYNAEYKVILQETAKDISPRPGTLPDAFTTTYQATAKDFASRFYFRHNESHQGTFPVEYCGVTVLTDDDDNVTGYVEVSLNVLHWLDELAKLTSFSAGLYDFDANAFSKTTDNDLYSNISTKLKDKKMSDGTLLVHLGDKSFLSDLLPIKDPAQTTIHWLWVTRDYTKQAQIKRKNKIINIVAIIVLSIFSLTTLLFFFRTNVIKPILGIASGLKEGGDRIKILADQVAHSGENIAEGASEQAASLEETSASLEETSAMSRQNAENSHQAKSLVQESLTVITHGNDSMKNLSNAMETISTASVDTLKIVKTIDEIAFQTNLLALNAAVEAARAGEAGAGFAVVADEVRNLAMRAAEAARETNELIEGNTLKIRDGSNLVKETADAFSQIVESSSKVSALISEITSASEEQAHGVEQLNKAIAEMDIVTQRNAATAEESSAVAEEMSSNTNQINIFIDDLTNLVGK